MKTICLYFQVHQPFRFRRYRFFDIGNDHHYYDDYSNRSIMQKVAKRCYLPANKVMLDLIKKHGKKFKLAFSITGSALEQFELYAPEVLESFKKLAKTGNVEFLAETYSHSLAALKNKEEFTGQVERHSQKIEALFGKRPQVFRNTELVYSDEIGQMAAQMGFKAVITEGAKHILGWKSPNFLYYNPLNKKLKLILKNYKLSDDIAYRFSNRAWDEWPLTAAKFVQWIADLGPKEELVNLFMDYETFGEHQSAETGIFDFLRAFPTAVFREPDFKFATPSEVAKKHQPIAAMNVPYPISWADEERDLTAWLGNDLQYDSFDTLYSLTPLIREINDPELLRDWNRLQNSDHFYYMCTKFFSDGDVHEYFNPYDSPYDAFINYMNVLSDFMDRVQKATQKKPLGNVEIPENINQQEAEQLIKKYQDAIEQLKKKASKPKPISKTKKEATPISKIKKEAKPISKTKPKPKAISGKGKNTKKTKTTKNSKTSGKKKE